MPEPNRILLTLIVSIITLWHSFAFVVLPTFSYLEEAQIKVKN